MTRILPCLLTLLVAGCASSAPDEPHPALEATDPMHEATPVVHPGHVTATENGCITILVAENDLPVEAGDDLDVVREDEYVATIRIDEVRDANVATGKVVFKRPGDRPRVGDAATRLSKPNASGSYVDPWPLPHPDQPSNFNGTIVAIDGKTVTVESGHAHVVLSTGVSLDVIRGQSFVCSIKVTGSKGEGRHDGVVELATPGLRPAAGDIVTVL